MRLLFQGFFELRRLEGLNGVRVKLNPKREFRILFSVLKWKKKSPGDDDSPYWASWFDCWVMVGFKIRKGEGLLG